MTVNYPVDVLEGCHSALALFASAFLGENDSQYLADAGIRTTCVDVNPVTLDQMSALYPVDWEFECADAWEYADAAMVVGRRWDVITIDPFTGDTMRRSQETLELWCSLAVRAVVIGAVELDRPAIPDGWSCRRLARNNRGVYWLVLTRD